jgi:hypothetical protein
MPAASASAKTARLTAGIVGGGDGEEVAGEVAGL